MGQVIRTWVDILCSECYSVLSLKLPDGPYYKKKDDSEFCPICNDWVFPIVVLKREYNTRKAVAKGCQRIERDISHGIEIVHIDGEGITKNMEIKDK